jgi:peptidyl-prolyl cis-trans isomerase SurA
MMKLGTIGRAALVLAGSVAAVTAIAQTAGAPRQGNLNIPANPNFLGGDPAVRKATAIVNGDIITGTDVDQRMALVLIANGATSIPPEELQRLREQVLRNLVDETLQIQAAKAQDIKVEPREIENYYQQYLKNLKQTPQQFEAYLRQAGSSPASLKRQIHGEIAWSRLQRRNIDVNVAEEEVRSVIDRFLNAPRAQEFPYGEIFLSRDRRRRQEARSNHSASFSKSDRAAFVRSLMRVQSRSLDRAGRLRSWAGFASEQLPDMLAPIARSIPVGTVSDPVSSARAFLDRRGSGHAPDPHGGSTRCGAEPLSNSRSCSPKVPPRLTARASESSALSRT